MVRVVLILLLALLQAFFGAPDFLLGAERYWLRALSYSFFHGSWWHLAVNSLAIWTIYKQPFIIAVAVYPISIRPVIGFSNVLYAALGLRTPSLKSRWWRQAPVIAFLAITIALVFIPRFSATTHIASFLLGMAGAAAKRFYLDLSRDARRYL